MKQQKMATFKSFTSLPGEGRPQPPTGGIPLLSGQFVYPFFLSPPPSTPQPVVPADASDPPKGGSKLQRKNLPKAVDHTCPTEEPPASTKGQHYGSTNDEEITNRQLRSKTLTECAVKNSDVISCTSRDCSFHYCDIIGGTLKDVELVRCNVWKANLDDLCSRNVKFIECEIHEAELNDSCFLDCKIKSSETKGSVRAQSTRFTDCTINNNTTLLLSKQCKFIMCGGSGVPEDESSSSDEEWGVRGAASGGNDGSLNTEPSQGVLLGSQGAVVATPVLPDTFTA